MAVLISAFTVHGFISKSFVCILGHCSLPPPTKNRIGISDRDIRFFSRKASNYKGILGRKELALENNRFLIVIHEYLRTSQVRKTNKRRLSNPGNKQFLHQTGGSTNAILYTLIYNGFNWADQYWNRKLLNTWRDINPIHQFSIL